MADCSKKNTCINYPAKCVNCGATSDIYNHYPCYKDVDEVKVVRCKDCKYYETHKPLVTLNCERNDGKLIPMMPDDFCSYGERKNDNGNG
jgi:hypothetical protein